MRTAFWFLWLLSIMILIGWHMEKRSSRDARDDLATCRRELANATARLPNAWETLSEEGD